MEEMKKLWIEAENRVFDAFCEAIVTGCEHITEMTKIANINEEDIFLLGEEMVEEIATEVWNEFWTKFE